MPKPFFYGDNLEVLRHKVPSESVDLMGDNRQNGSNAVKIEVPM